MEQHNNKLSFRAACSGAVSPPSRRGTFEILIVSEARTRLRINLFKFTTPNEILVVARQYGNVVD